MGCPYTQEQQISPKSPASPSGIGNFKDSVIIDTENGPPTSTVAANGPSASWNSVGANVGTSIKPPPVTATLKKDIKVEKRKYVDINIKVEVLSDVMNSSSLKANQAQTRIEFSNVKYSTPGYSSSNEGGKNIIKSFNGDFEFKGVITIQTRYGPNTNPTDISGYGRGTTKLDMQNGNTSLGFHENCHQQDYLNYLDKNTLPELDPKIDMRVSVFEKKVREFKYKFKKYQKRIDKSSLKTTDEVGYKKSQCIKDGKCTK